jgi:hypothetical protein
MIDYSPMDEGEIEIICTVLKREKWVSNVVQQADRPSELQVKCIDNKIWCISKPIHHVRLMYQYNRWRLDLLR